MGLLEKSGKTWEEKNSMALRCQQLARISTNMNWQRSYKLVVSSICFEYCILILILILL